MDAQTSNFLFIGLFLIIISPCSQQDEIAPAQKPDSNWATTNWIAVKADDWIKTNNLTTAKPFFVKFFRGETDDVLKFNPNLFKLKPGGKDPVKFSLKYWISKNFTEGFQFFDHRTKKNIDLKYDQNHPNEFITNEDFAKTEFTFDDLRESELLSAFRTKDRFILLQDITVNYSDFRSLTTNFNKTTSNSEMEFVFSSENHWGQIQQVFDADQFDRIYIQTNLTDFHMYLSLENDDYAKPVSPAYRRSFLDGICLKEIFAMNPNGRFMIVIKALDLSNINQGESYSVKFLNEDPKKVVPNNPDDNPFNEWIYNIDLPKIYDFELNPSPAAGTKFYACDSMAACFEYQPKSGVPSKFELKKEDRESLKSPIMKRISIPHDITPNITGSFREKYLQALVGNLTNIITDDTATITVHQPDTYDFLIPYIDLRVYEPTVKFDSSISVKSISIKSDTSKIISKISFTSSMDQFFTNNTIDLGRFFHPRIGDDFNNYQFYFNVTVSQKSQVYIKLGNKKNPTMVAADGYATVQTSGDQIYLKESDWIMAPITSSPKSTLKGDAVFEFDGTDKSKQIKIKHQIQYYDGTGNGPGQESKKNADSKIVYSIEEKIKGPYKVFYWITMPKEVSLKNFSYHFQDIAIKDEDQIKKGPTNEWYDRKYDPADSSACPIGFEWNGSKHQCFLQVDSDQTKNHLPTTIKCDESNGCSNIFDKPLMNSSLYSNGSVLELIGNQDFNEFNITSIFIPFADPTNHTNQISIPIEAENGKDFCIHFKHFGFRSQLYAFGEFDPEYKIRFEDDETSMKEHKNLYSEDSICASDLSPEPIDQIGSIILTFEDDPKLNRPLEQSIADLIFPEVNSSQKSIPGIMQDELKKLEMNFPRYDLSLFTDQSGSINFNLDENQLAPNQEKFQRTLSTKFLPLYKYGKNKTIDIGLTYDGNFLDLGGQVWIQFRPESKSKYKIQEWKKQPMQHLVYEPNDPNLLVENVQVQFVFLIENLAEMKKKTNETYFSIKDLSIDDPCVGDNNSLTDFCSGLPNACQRYFNSSPWKKWHKCNCSVEQYRYGDECQSVDFCQRDKKTDYCLENRYGKCRNDQKKNSWYCTCDGARTWISIGEYCSMKIDNDFKCPDNEIIRVKDLEKPECVCEDGLVRINKECVEFDVCNVDHRKANGMTPEQPCTDQFAECRKTSLSDYQCVCKDFLSNKDGNFKEDVQCIDQLCNMNLKCEQRCRSNSTNAEQSKCECFNENYVMDPDQKHCKIKTELETEEKNCLPSENVEKLSVFERAFLTMDKTCGCKLEGYEFNSKSKKCEAQPDKDKVKKILHCQQIKMNEDNQPECICPTGQTYNHELGVCSYERCPQPDQIRYISDPEHPDQSKCLDACDENLVERCKDEFARCDGKKVIQKFRESIPNQNVLVFINGTSQKLDQTVHCGCIVGFEKNHDGKCEADVSKSMMTVELAFINTKDKQQTKNYLEKILKQIFSNKPVSIENINCEDNGTCQVSMVVESTLKPETVIQSLDNQCVDENQLKKNGGNSEKCVYILKSDSNPMDFMIPLSRSKSTPITCVNDRCFSDPCKRFPHTKCHANQDVFVCECIDPYTKAKSNPVTKGEIEICALSNCEQKGVHCEDPSAKCLILDPNEADEDVSSIFSSKSILIQHRGMQLCICDDGYILPNRSGHCDEHKNCDLDCHQHGQCDFLQNGIKICRCNEGWGGDFCEKAIDNNHDHDKHDTDVVISPSNAGFKISTIVLAVLSALLVVGVVYLFMKK